MHRTDLFHKKFLFFLFDYLCWSQNEEHFMIKIEASKDLRAELKSIFEDKTSKKFIITDENVFPHIKDFLNQGATGVFIMTPGEKYKDLTTCTKIWEKLADLKYNRNDLIINIGGGVVTDLGGFIASTFKRGVRFVNVPSSLLAMVDAAIGGKTGIDFLGYKNQIGSFYFPEETIIATELLKTLPEQELVSGFAEVLKHGLISNKEYWEECSQKPLEELDWEKIVWGSIEVKSRIVEEDPQEKGLRKLLNFGHTIGHAVETYLLNTDNSVLHGEAVAAGMLMESYISKEKALLSNNEFEEIEKVILKYYSKIEWNAAVDKELIDLMRNDKKNNSAVVNFTLLDKIGQGSVNHLIQDDLITKALLYYRSL